MTIEKALKWRADNYYDRKEARRVVRFFSDRLKHTMGDLAGQPFVLERWQRTIVRRLFGWKRRKDGTRKHRTLFLFVPRKNGKSTFGSGLALYLLHADKEKGARIVSAADTSETAAVIFDAAKEMNDMDEVLAVKGETFKRTIVVQETGSNYMCISADGNTKHGKNLHGILFDELHTQPNRNLFDVLKSSMGSRKQPLQIYITTAGYDRQSICYEQYDYAKRLISGEIENPAYMPVIFEAKPPEIKKDEAEYDAYWWTKEEVWKTANPNYGISIQTDFLKEECLQAMQIPAYENTFKRLYLNVWTESDTRAVNMLKWQECGKVPLTKEVLKGKDCWVGLDLSSTEDLSAAAYIFKEGRKWQIFVKLWCPVDMIIERSQKSPFNYKLWADQGFLIPTPGNKIDYGLIRNEVNLDADYFTIREVAMDPFNAHQLSHELETEDGFTVSHVRQGTFGLNAATKEFISSVSSLDVEYVNNPVLTWNVGNLSTDEDSDGNLKPSKEKSKEKIDACSAIVTAMSRALVAASGKSVYKERGITTW